MRVLVACEFSGVVRNAFGRRGHDAWSCDLLPAADGHHRHLQMDIENVLESPVTITVRWAMAPRRPPSSRATSTAST